MVPNVQHPINLPLSYPSKKKYFLDACVGNMPYLPPLNLIRKKMNSWHLTSRLTARSFSESTASRVRSGRCPRQCTTLLHGQMYLQEKTPVLQFGHTLEQNSSIRPIISYLWMVDLVMRFFSCGANL